MTDGGGNPAAFHSGFVAVVGRPNVGKSTLVNRLVGEKVAIVSDKPQTTRNRILAVLNRRDGQVVLFDTPGIHKPMHRMNKRMVEAAVNSLGQVDLALWLLDVTEEYGPGDRYVRDVLERSGKPVMLGLNKIDLVPKPRLLPLIDQHRRLLDFVDVVPVSGLKGENVDRLAERLVANLPEGERLYPDDFLTDQPERFFVAEMVREQILRHTREEIPYSTAVIIDSFKEGPPLVRIEASILVERESQKGILIGRGGAMLKAIEGLPRALRQGARGLARGPGRARRDRPRQAGGLAPARRLFPGRVRALRDLAGSPVPERLPNHDELPDVVRVVIAHQQQLAQVRLGGSVGDAGEEVGSVFGQLLQLVPVAAERGDALVPGFRGRRGRRWRPVICGKGQLDVSGVPAEIEDVVLRPPQVLEDLPRGVGEPLGHHAADRGADAVDRRVEAGVGLIPVEELLEVRPQGRVAIGPAGHGTTTILPTTLRPPTSFSP